MRRRSNAAAPSPRASSALDPDSVPVPGGTDSAARAIRRSHLVHGPLRGARHALRGDRGGAAGGRTAGRRVDDGGLDARFLPDPRVRAARRGGQRRHPRRAAARGGQVEQEPLAGRDRRRRPDRGGLPGLLSGDERPHELGGGRLRDAERRADVPHAGRRGASPPRRAHRAGPGLERERHRPAPGPRRPAAQLPRGGLRHAGRFAHHRRQPDDLPLRGGRHAPRPRQRRRRRGVGRSDVGRRRRAHHARAAPALGLLPLRPLPLPEHAGRGRRRARAQGLDPAHGEPLDHPRPPSLSPLARHGQPRAVPRLERQAVAARRPRAVRLRARGLHAQPVDGGGG